MRKRIDFELKVGIFVFIGLIILTIIVFSISDFRSMSSGYYLKVMLNFANGIEVGAPVRLAGVKVGTVKDINIVYLDECPRPQVELLIWVEKKTKIHSSSLAHIDNLGLLGEKYLEIAPGSKESPVLKEGDLLKGKDSVSLADVTELGYKIATKMDRAITSLSELFNDLEVRIAFKETLKNSQKLTEEFGALGSSVREILEKVKRGEGTVGKFLSDDKLYDDLDEFVQDLKAHPWKLLYRPRSKRKK